MSAKPVISQPQNEITNQRILLVEIHTCVLLISVDVVGRALIGSVLMYSVRIWYVLYWKLYTSKYLRSYP